MISRSCLLFFFLQIDAHRLSCQFADYSIILSCNISASVELVSLIDNHGNDVARCALKGSSSNCSSKDFVKPVIGENEVIFYVHRNRTTGLNGNWFCSQENIMIRPEILSSKADKTASTIVNLVGKIVHDDDTQRLLLTCSSCRIPNENHAEFLINNNSVDSISYNDATGKCTYSYGECSSGKCNCSSSRNAFSRFFLMKKQLNTETYFSCDMRFHIEDKEHLVVFSKVSTLSFNGTDFKDRGTHTVIIKLTDIQNRPKDKDSNTASILISVISASVIMVITLLTVTVYCNRKGRRLEKKKNIASAEGAPLLAHKEDKILFENEDHNRSSGNCLQCDIHGKHLYTKPGTHDQSVQVNFDAEHHEETEDEVYVQAPEDLTSESILDTTETRSKPNNEHHEETEDEVYVQPPEYLTSESILDTTETRSKPNNEHYEETEDEVYVQAPEDLTSKSILDTTETKSKQNNDQTKSTTRIKEVLEANLEDNNASYNDFPYPNNILNKRVPAKVTEDFQSHMKRGSCHGNIKLDSWKATSSYQKTAVEAM